MNTENASPFQRITERETDQAAASSMNGWSSRCGECAWGRFKAILAALLVGGVLSIGSWAFAQGGGGNYTFLPSKLGYGNVPAPALIDLSDMTSNRAANISMGGKSWETEKSEKTTQLLSWETGAGKSYLIPALEIPAFILLLNGYDRLAYPNELTADGERVYETNLSTFRDHLVHGSWQVDKDPFGVNQLGHPYQGSIYHGLARSAGLNYWESLLYTNAGSLLWELGGENTPPSINDQIASGIAGSFFGEALFRMASLVLEDGDGKPGPWRELGATIISPSTGINRFSFGDRFKPVFPSRKPATSWRLRLGASLKSDLSDQGGSNTINRSEATALGLQYTASHRDVRYPDRPSNRQTVETVSLVYTLLGSNRFGAVEWRDADNR